MTNGTPTNLYVPSDVHLGGSRTSASQLEVFSRCIQEGFLSYIAPHPGTPDSAGLRGRVVEAPLMTGTGVHAGLHAYLLSGWRDGEDTGERDIIKAQSHARSVLEAMRHTASTPEDFTKSEAETNSCLEKFDEMMVSGRLSPRRVAGDANGDPVLEREFALPLADGRFIYINKIDAMTVNPEGYHQVTEFKTSAASFAEDAIMGLGLIGQNLGHMKVIMGNWPNAPINGLLVYVLVKNRGGKSKLPAIYEQEAIVSFDVVDNYFDHTVVPMLEGIVDRTQAWADLVSEGWDPYQAGLAHFPQTGIANKSCKRYRRPCPFAAYCEASGFGSKMLTGFRPRTVAGEAVKDDGPTDSMEGEMF